MIIIIIDYHEGGCNDTDQDGHRTCINVEFDTQIKTYVRGVGSADDGEADDSWQKLLDKGHITG